jgi:iron complex outermembrane receptor protein
MENQQFGDEHGLGLNDAGVESVEVIKGLLLYYMVQMRWVVYILTLRNLQMRIPLKRT